MDVKRIGDPYLSVAAEAFRLLCEAASPGAFLVNLFPVCSYYFWWQSLHAILTYIL